MVMKTDELEEKVLEKVKHLTRENPTIAEVTERIALRLQELVDIRADILDTFIDMAAMHVILEGYCERMMDRMKELEIVKETEIPIEENCDGRYN